MKYPALSPPHGTSLGTTAGITAIITLVAAVSALSQSADLDGPRAVLAALGVTALVLGAGGLYAGRNQIGIALDFAASQDPAAAGVAAAAGFLRFHLGMAAAFAGTGLTAVYRLALPQGGIAWLAPLAGAVLALLAFRQALGWRQELVRRRQAGSRQEA